MNMKQLEKDIVITMIKDSGLSAETQMMCNAIGYDCFSPYLSGVAGVFMKENASRVRALVYDDMPSKTANNVIPNGLSLIDVLRDAQSLDGIHMFNNSSVDFSEVFSQQGYLHNQSCLPALYKVLDSYKAADKKPSFFKRLLIK